MAPASNSTSTSAYKEKLLARDAKCQVQGCDNELPTHVGFYKRRKICVTHATLPQVMLDGKAKRFCQQCGRFQPLKDFEGYKKSCAAALVRHNKRREARLHSKASTSNSAGSGSAANQPETTASAGDADNNALAAATTEAADRQASVSAVASRAIAAVVAAAQQQQHARGTQNLLRYGNGTNSNTQDLVAPPGHLPQLRVPPPTSSEAADTSNEHSNNDLNGNHVLAQHPMLTLPNLNDDDDVLDEILMSLTTPFDDAPDLENPFALIPAPRTTQAPALAVQEHQMLDNLHRSGSNPLQSEHAPMAVNYPYNTNADVVEQHQQQQQQQRANLAAVMAMAGGPSYNDEAATSMDFFQQQQQHPDYDAATNAAIAAANAATAAAAAAAEAAAEAKFAAGHAIDLNALTEQVEFMFSPEQRLAHCSVKLFGLSPDDMPDDVRQSVQHAVLGLNVPDHYFMQSIRHGCVLISTSTLLNQEELKQMENSGASGILRRVLMQGDALGAPQASPRGSLGDSLRALTQFNDRVATAQCSALALSDDGSAKSGSSDSLVSLSARQRHRENDAIRCLELNKATAPHAVSMVPLAMTPHDKDKILLLFGRNISQPHDVVAVRHNNACANSEVLRQGSTQELRDSATLHPTQGSVASGIGAGEYVRFRVPELRQGLHLVEVQREHALSQPLPFLVLDDERAVWELRELESTNAIVNDVPAFVQSVGVVLDHLAARNRNHLGGATDGDDDKHQQGSDDVAHRIARVAQGVLAVCVLRGWYALTHLILPAVIPPGGTPATALDGIKASTGNAYDVLHLAAASGCVVTLNELRKWGERVGHQWNCLATSSDGRTPLHVVAATPTNESCLMMAAVLTSMFSVTDNNGHSLWFSANSKNGTTPAEVAHAVGNTTLLSWLSKFQESSATATATSRAAVAATTTTTSSRAAAKGSSLEELVAAQQRSAKDAYVDELTHGTLMAMEKPLGGDGGAGRRAFHRHAVERGDDSRSAGRVNDLAGNNRRRNGNVFNAEVISQLQVDNSNMPRGAATAPAPRPRPRSPTRASIFTLPSFLLLAACIAVGAVDSRYFLSVLVYCVYILFWWMF